MNHVTCNDFDCKNNVDGICKADIVFIDDKRMCISENKFFNERLEKMKRMKDEKDE